MKKKLKLSKSERKRVIKFIEQIDAVRRDHYQITSSDVDLDKIREEIMYV